MDWLRGIRELLSSSDDSTEETGSAPESTTGAGGGLERAAPGVAALFETVGEREEHAVLDLGPASGSSLEIYNRYAGRVRFADLLADRAEHGLADALRSLPQQPDRPYDMVFAWDTFDRLRSRERARLVRRLDEVTSSRARLHLVIDTSEETTRSPPLRFTLLDVDRVRCEPSGPERLRHDRLLPAEVEEMLGPFRVVRGFTLKGGIREYVAARGTTGR